MLPTDDRVDRFRPEARKIARRYARRCSWVDAEDAEQEAWAFAILPALRSFDPEKVRAPSVEEGLRRYVQRAIARWLRGYVWERSKAVSFSSHDLRRDGAALEELRGVASWSLDALSSERDVDQVPGTLRALSDPTPAPDAALADLRWRQEAEAAIEDALADLEASDAFRAKQMLSGESRPAEVAAETGRRVGSVYSLRDAAYVRIASSPAVHEAWDQRRRRTG